MFATKAIPTTDCLSSALALFAMSRSLSAGFRSVPADLEAVSSATVCFDIAGSMHDLAVRVLQPDPLPLSFELSVLP